MKNIKIQSVSDLITNSSTEAFLVKSADAEEIIVRLVEEVARMGGTEFCFNDSFEFYSHTFTEEEITAYLDYVREVAHKQMQSKWYTEYKKAEVRRKLDDMEKDLLEGVYFEEAVCILIEELGDVYSPAEYFDIDLDVIECHSKEPSGDKIANLINDLNNLFYADAEVDY